MGVELHNLKPNPGSHQDRKRVGRGDGSGMGKTCGRGQKGQKARSGVSIPAGFEGGQMPLHRRLPKRGFNPMNPTEYQVVNVRVFEEIEESEITPDLLRSYGLIGSRQKPVKILGSGEVDRKLTVMAHAFSGTAREKIESAGGTVVVVDDEGNQS